ncbi:MAG TPA: sodium:proline symporter, partial [Planctomycetota bacterium]|nr:sodium:proline symporter [Planctomycetota bacterium]
LLAFYRKVRPDGPGWRKIAALAPDVQRDGRLGLSILAALVGTAIIWLVLPGIGMVIFGRWTLAAELLGSALACALALRQMLPFLRVTG